MSFKEKYGDRWDCLHILLDKKQKQQLKLMAELEGVSMSAMARYILGRYWNQHKGYYPYGGEL